MFSYVFKLIANQTEAEQPTSEGELLVIAGGLGELRGFLVDCLCADCEGEGDVASDFPGVERAVKKSEFYRTLGEHRVEVQRVVSAVIVVRVLVFIRIIRIPYFTKFVHREILFFASFKQYVFAGLLAIINSVGINL